MHNILEKSMKLRKSSNLFARICGNIGVWFVLRYAKHIDKTAPPVVFPSSVLSDKEIIRQKIIVMSGKKGGPLLQKRYAGCYNYPEKPNKGGSKMAKVYTFLATGFEEIEALTAVDLLRRGGVEVCMVSVTGQALVTGAHQVAVQTDLLYQEMDPSDGDMLLLPGGQPGTTNLSDYKPLTELLKRWHKNGKKLAAICAAPTVFGGLGLLVGKKATCYPGYEMQLTGADVVTDRVVTDGNITTSRAVGTAISFGLELVRVLVSREKADEVQQSIVYGH